MLKLRVYNLDAVLDILVKINEIVSCWTKLHETVTPATLEVQTDYGYNWNVL